LAVTPNERFYRIDTAVTVPRVDVRQWSLRVTGLVDLPLTYRYADLLGMDLVEEPVTIACVSNDVGGGLIGNASWRGVPLAAILGPAGVRREATQLIGRSVDGFTVGFSPALALDGRPSMVALGMNGVPLPAEHGHPARLIVPGLYGYASATKWLTELELTRWEDAQSYWVERGWDRDGLINVQSRVDLAGPDPEEPGTVVIAGVAWAPPFGVAKVEVQLDRGAWLPAELGEVASPNTWVQWRYRWRGAPAGDHLVTARVTDGAGRAQIEEPSRAEPSGATGYDYRGFSVG
jgi:DMSO/TMAO reductase YedYZ molybdopterin-dependent catalytic subunit